jgi:hypothetical protein
MLLGACSDDTDTDLDSPDTIGLHLFNGWTAEVPISPEVRSIAFENWRGGEWERIYTVDAQPEKTPSSLPVYIIPGVDLEREAVYAIVGFRGAYRVPDGLNGKLVWNGVEKVSEGCYQILALETDQGVVPCVRVKTITKSEQGADDQLPARAETKAK